VPLEGADGLLMAGWIELLQPLEQAGKQVSQQPTGLRPLHLNKHNGARQQYQQRQSQALKAAKDQ
jgi:hypothetical protein